MNLGRGEEEERRDVEAARSQSSGKAGSVTSLQLLDKREWNIATCRYNRQDSESRRLALEDLGGPGVVEVVVEAERS